MSCFRSNDFSGSGKFKHGIHPPENKGLSEDSRVEVIDTPKMVVIPLLQHVGAPCKQIVEPKQDVKHGEMIGTGEAFISTSAHSPVSGKVFKVDNITDTSGYKRQSIIIKVEGDEWEESIDRSPELKKEITLDQKEIVERIFASQAALGASRIMGHVSKLPVPGPILRPSSSSPTSWCSPWERPSWPGRSTSANPSTTTSSGSGAAKKVSAAVSATAALSPWWAP